MLRSSSACEQLLSLRSGAHALQPESSPHWPQLEKNPSSNEDPAQPQINKSIFKNRLCLKQKIIVKDAVLNIPKGQLYNVEIFDN